MPKYFKKSILVIGVLFLLGSAEIKSDADSSPAPANPPNVSSTSSSSSNSDTSSSSSKDTSTPSNKDTTAKSTAKVSSTSAPASEITTPVSNTGLINNVDVANVQVEPYSGSSGLSIPIQVPPGRAGIQPNLALVYNSGGRQLSNAGVSWTLDLGSIQRSTKKGIPTYNDSQDIFTMEQGGSTQDLVADPNTAGLYHMEVEGAFANIQYFTTYWVITDKKGIKYYYGNYGSATGCIQNDPANPTHIFRWSLSRVEDLNGNYMIISYLQDNGQLYPQTISYTGNDNASLNLTTYAQVNISYVAATIPSTSYISQFLVETAKRIDHITVAVGPNVQSTYTFTYHQSAYSYRDLLQSVQQTGADGTSTLPAVNFSYSSDTAAKGFQIDDSWNLSNVPYFSQNNGQIWQDLGVRIADFNGDGYPDIVQMSTPANSNQQLLGTTSQLYLNSTQKSWTATGNGQFNDPDLPGDGFGIDYTYKNYYYGIQLVDLDGDGLPDFTQGFRENPNYGTATSWAQMGINNGPTNFVQDTAWYLPSDAYINYVLSSDYTVYGGTSFASINGAGFSDIAIARNANYTSHNVYFNNENNFNKGWTLNSQYVTPSNVDFTNGAALVDLNGDGMADIINLVGGVATVYMNTGNGWALQSNSGYANTAGLGDLTNGTTQFIDVNGDGLPDIVIANGSTYHVLINTGNGWVQDDSWAPQGANFTNFGTQFLDANATGMVDYLISIPGQQQMYINQGQLADLLVGVNNGIGATTSINYDSALHFQNTYMPYFIPVVKSTTTTVGSDNYITNYSYAGGLWDKVYREFDGFQSVTVTDPYGNYVTSTFLQDHWLKGHPREQDTYDSNGNLYSKSVNAWGAQTIATNSNLIVGGAAQVSKFLFVSRTDNYLYDGNNSATPKRTAQEFTYGENPQYGDVTQVVNDGQVDPVAGTSIDPNKTTTQTTYVNNSSNNLLGLPSVTTTQDINSNIIAKTSFYYDNDTTGTASPSLGRLTAKVNRLGSNTQPDPKTTYSYDPYGNLSTTTDPKTNKTTITYDNTVHMFPEQTTNALNQKVTMTYYGIDGVALNGAGLQGLWGQDASKTDANNQTAYNTYDVFGRPSTSISPLDTVASPTEQKSYNIQSTYIAVTDTARVNSGSSATISTVSFYDGLGRLIEKKTLGPTAGQYIVSGQTVYDSRGLPITKYLPYFTTNNLTTMDSIDTTQPASQATYDPMGRVITKINPDGTYSSMSYNQWTTASTDENGHMQQNTMDAFGRLVQKQEYMGADGRSPYYPAAAYSVYATTSYQYDPRGDLIKVTDAHNNVTTITYDNLGRKIAMNDPDMGKWQYGYDSNSNLIWQEDAKTQVISFTYDALNRLTNKTDAITGPIINLPNLPLQAATFNVNYNFDDQSQNYGIGRLGSVTYDSGTASFVYDQLGREVSSNKTVGGNQYNVTRQYDDLNRLAQLQYPDRSQVTYGYNQAGQATSVLKQ